MDYIPQDPHIACSSINMLLRDEEFDSLEELCNCFDQDPQELLQRMLSAGYRYDPEQKQFKLN